MRKFAQVRHEEWIAAAPAVVRSQFADLDHHIRANVHPKLSFEVLERSAESARYVQHVKLLGIRQRDVFVRQFGADGSMTDTSVEGFNKNGSLHFEFTGQRLDGRDGTRVAITVRLPLPPVIGGVIRPLLESQVRREVVAAVAEDKYDLEVRGYRSGHVAPTSPQMATA